MVQNAFLWPRGDYFLNHFIPLDFSPVKTPRTMKPTVEAAHTFLDVCAVYKFGKLISYDDWNSAMQFVGVEDKLETIIFQNCLVNGQEKADKERLALDIILLCMEHYSYNGERVLQTHGDVMCELLRELLYDVITVLVRCLDKYEHLTLEHFNKILSEENVIIQNFQFLDQFFEGSVNGNLVDEVLSVSQIGSILLREKWPLSISSATSLLKTWLISNPFSLNDISIVKNPKIYTGTKKQTSLGTACRRRVIIAQWSRMEILRKGVYHNVHLRITSNQANASFLFSPWSSQSVLIEHVHNCPGIILGPSKGAVIIKDCTNTTVSCLAKSIILWKCENITLFCSSVRPIVLRECENIRLAPYNVAYSGLKKELLAADLNLKYLQKLERNPVALDESTWKPLKSTFFYIQPVPFERSEIELTELLETLPTEYNKSWKVFLHNSNNKIEKEIKNCKLSKKDLSYLKSKIDVNNNN